MWHIPDYKQYNRLCIYCFTSSASLISGISSVWIPFWRLGWSSMYLIPAAVTQRIVCGFFHGVIKKVYFINVQKNGTKSTSLTIFVAELGIWKHLWMFSMRFYLFPVESFLSHFCVAHYGALGWRTVGLWRTNVLHKELLAIKIWWMTSKDYK